MGSGPGPKPSGVSGVGLSHRYEGFEALKDVSLDVRPGEFLTLLGPSGSGKTTMLSVIAGLVNPIDGQVRFDGEDVIDVPSRAATIGFVFQAYALFPHLSVAENLAFPLSSAAKAERAAGPASPRCWSWSSSSS